jgi:dTDP-4-dehydrorhamnose reductase
MSQRILVTGATGQLGAYVVHELVERGADVVAWSHSSPTIIAGVTARPVELTNANAVAAAFRDAAPTAVIHAGALAAVADCARDPTMAVAVNYRGSDVLAYLASVARTKLVLVSTDLVFDGERGNYTEDDPPSPLSVYGRTKADAERVVLAYPEHAVVRVSLLFGPSRNGRASFFDSQVASLRNGEPIRCFQDEWRTPLALPIAAKVLVEIASLDATGLLHVGGPERLSRLEMGQRLAAHLGANPALIEAVSRMSIPGEPRPRDTSLNSSRWRGLVTRAPWPGFTTSLAEMGVTGAR